MLLEKEKIQQKILEKKNQILVRSNVLESKKSEVPLERA